MTTADFDTIAVPRPKPDEVVIAITDADGASAWVFCPKAYLADGALLEQFALCLEDGQRLLHEQREAAAASQ